MNYEKLNQAGIIINNRYSKTDKCDKQGRWMRTFHYNNLMIGILSKVFYEGIDFYTLRPFFPCGNCFTSVHPILQNKNDGQILIDEFLELWNDFNLKLK